MQNSKLYIISGERKVGKTTFCRKIIETAKAAGWQVSGVLSPAIFCQGEKIGINLLDLKTGVQQQLARARRLDEDTSFSLNWVFDKDQLKRGNEILKNTAPCDLLVIDELGPLELLHGQGWQAGIRVLESKNYRLGLLVIRPELLEEALSRWPQAKVILIKENKSNIEDLQEIQKLII